MEEEMSAMKTNNVWTLVPPEGNDANIVSTKWVFKHKENDIYKARFVARGFTQQFGEDYDETFASHELVILGASRELPVDCSAGFG